MKIKHNNSKRRPLGATAKSKRLTHTDPCVCKCVCVCSWRPPVRHRRERSKPRPPFSARRMGGPRLNGSRTPATPIGWLKKRPPLSYFTLLFISFFSLLFPFDTDFLPPPFRIFGSEGWGRGRGLNNERTAFLGGRFQAIFFVCATPPPSCQSTSPPPLTSHTLAHCCRLFHLEGLHYPARLNLRSGPSFKFDTVYPPCPRGAKKYIKHNDQNN